MLDARLSEGPFDPAQQIACFVEATPAAGGVATFLGQVRSDAGVEALEIRHYPLMTLPGIRTLGEAAQRRWALDALLIVHRVGVMAPGDSIVLVAAAARHRREAFAATDFVMDHLKSDVWLWKRERTASGWRWIEPRAQDYADKARWG